MKRVTGLIIIAALLTGCEGETAAERTAKAYKTCREAGLIAKEGVNPFGNMVVYCTEKAK